MNRYTTHIQSIQTHEGVNCVTFANGIKMVSLQLGKHFAHEAQVVIGFRPSSVILGEVGGCALSVANSFEASISGVATGKILTIIHLQSPLGEVESLISTASFEAMKLDQKVQVYVDASAVSILEVLS